ncbi:MAG TPA: immunoglobulin domain-containing protein, partial [Verrucomicrobiae bacterium]|nr:immunoglobulin domain-containing protein [Verrucomicrobiae bacterium]
MEPISTPGLCRRSFVVGRSVSILVTVFLSSLAIRSSSAATIAWTGAVSTDWNNVTNWTPQQVPTSLDTAVINSGTVVVAANAQFSALTLNGGTLSGPVLVRSNCVMNWNDGILAASGSLTVQSNAVVNLQTGTTKYVDGPMLNYGTVIWTGGTLYVRNNNAGSLGSVVNLGLWQMQGDVDLGQWFATGLEKFTNGGTLRKASGSGISATSLILLNEFGNIEVRSGVLRLDRGTALDGFFHVSPGATIQFNTGTFNYTPLTRLTGAGQYQLVGGTLQGLPDYLPNLQLLGGSVLLSPTYQTNGTIERLDLNGAALASSNRVSGVLNLFSGKISGSLVVGSNAVLNWSGGRFDGPSLTIESNGMANLLGGQKELAGCLTNAGQVVWSAGTITMLNNASTLFGAVENQPGGVWDVQGDLSISQSPVNNYAAFRNHGLLKKSAGTGTASLDLPFYNLGTFKQLSGILNFGRDFSLYAGTVVFGIASNGFGRINLAGTASLGGNLGVELLGGFIPASSATYQVMSYAVLAGAFTNYDGLNAGFGRTFTPVYTPTNLTLQASATNGPNTAPSLSPISNVTIYERTTLAFTNTASDPNGNQILFSFVSAPTNATLGLTSGIFSWTPTEAQGNTTNLITLRAFDNGSPSLSATQSFTVAVIKTNHAPVLPQIASQLIGVGGTLTVTNIAGDADTPANLLTYTLLNPPPGVTITNGIITWSPGNPGSFQITTRVTDNGAPAMSATNTFTVSVMSKPVPPSGLVSYWTGDGTTADQNGLNDGALAGSASYATGLYGQAFNFTGGYLAVLNSASLSFGPTNALSVEMWVKRTQPAPAYPLYYFGKRVNCGVYNYQSPSDQISGGVYDPPVGEWRHFAWVFTGTEWLGYVNGALVHRTQTSLGASNSASLFIGASGTCSSPFAGLIDEVRLYNRALTSNEVATVYAGSAVGAPIISQQPLSQKVAVGTTVVFTASAYGLAPISYQWRFNGVPINGQTSPTLTLNNVSLGQSGIYDLVATNALGTVTSLPAELSVLQPPAISVQPVGLTVAVGSNVTLNVVATGTPTPTLSYQWRKGGIPIGGAVGSTLALNNVQVSDAGNYDVIVANWIGSVTSVVATVNVSAPIVWTGLVSTDWNNATNWNPQQVPTSTDTPVINSGTVVVAPNAQFLALTFNGGTLSGPVLVRSNRALNWNGGVLANGSLTVESNGVVNLQTSDAKYLDSPMTNSGAVLWTGGTFYVRNNNSGILGRVVNRGLWQMQGDFTLGQWFSSAFEVFVNNGTFRKSAGAGVGSGNVALQNQFGVVEVQSGTWRFDRGQQLDGLFITEAGAVIQFYQGTFTYTALTQLTGAGQYQLIGGTLLGLPDFLPNLKLLGGTVGLSPSFQTNGNIVRLDLDGATLLGLNRVTGVLNLNDGGVSGPLTIASNAVLNWNSGIFSTPSSLTVESGGMVNLLAGGTKYMDGPMVNSGEVIWTGGSFYIRNNGSGNLGSVVNVGLWQMQGDLSLSQWFATGLERFINGGTFRKASGSGSGVMSVVLLNEFGNVEVQSGVLRFDRGMALDGLFIAGLGATIQFNAGTFNYTSLTRLMGAGQYQLTGGTLQGLPDYLPNLQLLGGSVLLSPTYQTNGLIERLDLNGATLSGSNYVVGVLNWNGGSIAGSVTIASNAVLNWRDGLLVAAGSLTVQSNAVANLLTPGAKYLDGRMTNSGTVIWTDGPFYIRNNNSGNLGNAVNLGSWQMQGNLSLNQWFGNGLEIFNNSGTFHKPSGTGTGTITVNFQNEAGLIDVQTGLLSFNRPITFAGGAVRFGISSNDFGRIAVSGTVTLDGRIAATLRGGFIPATNASYQVMTFTSATGTFTNISGLDVGFGRSFTPAYAATTLTLQASVTNAPNNAPTLAPIANVSIPEGTSFTFTNTASDPDGDEILFSLVTAPTNATLGLTTGIFSWTPTEAQGNTTNLIILRAFDHGSPSLSVTQAFTIIVAKTNSSPVLAQISPQLMGVGGTLIVTNTASDPDLPASTLTYTLLSPPPGATVNTSGVITWSPTNPGSYTVTMRVSDNGAPSLSATNSFTVSVIPKPVPSAGLVSWWTGDGTTADVLGTNHGVLSGNAAYAPGLYGQAFHFTGGWLTVLHSASLSFAPGNAMSFELWARRTQGGYPVYYFGKRVGCGSANYQSPSDQISAGAYNPPVGEWRHFVWVYTGTEWLGYVNGGLVYRTETTLGPENLAALFIGASGTCGQSFVGLIDEARIYNRALSSGEITALYSGQDYGPPIISQQPQSKWVAAGTTAVLNSGAYGLAPLSYQWRFNGTPVGGQTSPTLTLNNVTTNQSGNYELFVSNSLGTAISQVAGLSVIQAPAIITQPQSQATFVSANVDLTVEATGTPTPTLSYQWRKSGIPIGGAVGATLSLNNVQVGDSGNYDVIVSNWAGSVTSAVATVNVAVPITWTGLLSSDWHHPMNWEPQQVPTSSDTAVINSGTVQLTTNSQFFALIFNGGSLSGPIVVRSNSVLNWNNGTLLPSGSITVASNAAVNLQTANAKTLDGPMTNSGSVFWNGGTLNVRNNNASNLGRIVNRGLWRMHGDLSLAQWFTTGFEIFVNEGAFRKSSGTGIGTFSAVLQNQSGVVEVQSGTLRFGRGEPLDGMFITAPGTVIQFNEGLSTYTALTKLTGAGEYQLTGGTLQGLLDFLPNLKLLGGSVQLSPTYQTNGLIVRLDLDGAGLLGSNRVSGVLNLNSGSVSGPLTVSSNAVLNWSTGIMNPTSSLVVESNGVVNLLTAGSKYLDGPMTNSGSVLWTGGTFYVRNNNSGILGRIVNRGLWQMQGDFDLSQWFASAFEVFVNNGTFRKSSGAGVGTFSVALQNQLGLVEVLSGTLRFDRGQQLDGTFFAAPGTVIQFNSGTSTYTPLTQFTGTGQYHLTGGTLLGLLDYLPNLRLYGGTVGLSPNYQTNGHIVRLDLDGSTLTGSNVVTGILNLNSGSLAGSVIIASNAVLNWKDGLVGVTGSLTVQSNGVA